MPIREQGIAALYFANQASPGLDVIELSRQGVLRVVKDIETPVEDDSNIVRGFRLHVDAEEPQFRAAWNATKLELHVAVSSDTSGFQIWDLGSSRRKAHVATEFSAGISCMDVERQRGNLNLAGSLDGTVALFDTRQQARRGVCRWTKGHKDAVLCTSLTASQEIVSMGLVHPGLFNVNDGSQAYTFQQGWNSPGLGSPSAEPTHLHHFGAGLAI